MDFRDNVRALASHWLQIVVVVILGVIAGGALTLFQPPVYVATAKTFVSTSSANTVTDLSQGGNYAQQIVGSYADIVNTPYVLEPVIQQLHLNTTSTDLAKRVTADAPINTVILNVSVSANSASEAASIANAVAQQLTQKAPDLTPGTATGSSSVRVTAIGSALPPQSPDSPRPIVNLSVGILGGLVIGILIALARDALDTRVRDTTSLARDSGLPILAGLQIDPLSRQAALVGADGRRAVTAEAYRTLRANLRFLSVDRRSAIYVVTSATPGEGKSTVSANLAVVLAEAGQRTLLIDADLRRPSISEKFGIDASIGLTDVLIGEVSIEQAVQNWGSDGKMDILPAGSIPPNPAELLQSAAMEGLLRASRENYDVILLDSPPLLPVSDAATLSRFSDGAILICAVGKTTRHELGGGIEALSKANVTIFGIVANMLRRRSSGGYEYVTYGSYGSTASTQA